MKKALRTLLALLLIVSMFAMVACQPKSPASTGDTPTPDNSGASSTPVQSGDSFDSYPHPKVVTNETMKIGYLVRSQNSEATVRSLNQAAIEAAHRGWELITIVYEEDTNFRDSFQNVVNQGVNAIIIGSGASQEAKIDLYAAARQAGIGVYCNDNQVVDGIISNCTMPNGIAGMELLYKIGEDYGWDLNVCVIEGRNQQLMIERCDPVIALIESGAYPNLSLLAVQDWTASGLAAAQSCYEITQAWIQKYGDDLDFIYTGADTFGVNAAEAIAQSGDTKGDKIFSCGIDGGSRAFAYLRNETPFLYSYSQPFELYTHTVFEVIDSIQIRGLNPGDAGCPISQSGETLTFTGFITTRDNCPAVGDNIHTAFGYYDPNNADAWYNWTDGPGAYVVTEYVAG